jgi:glutamate-5-semialdehyde dehydrogenase
VDAAADLDMALDVVEDSKCQYVAVCNAAETLLVHALVAPAFLPRLRDRLAPRGVELRGCPRTVAAIGGTPAGDADWDAEYLDLILSVRVVDDLDEAVAHIHRHGSGHTDAIVTADAAVAEQFLRRIDSGSVFWNASTRFADGFRYGLGAEVGISTSKLHARGPVGLEGLTSYKWLLRGRGHVVAPYADGRRRFTHRPLA